MGDTSNFWKIVGRLKFLLPFGNRYIWGIRFTNWNNKTLNEETCENEVAYVHLNVPWAQQAEKKSLNPGFLITIPSVQI